MTARNDTLRALALRGRLLLGSEWVRGAVVVHDGRIVEIRRGDALGDLPAPVAEAEYVSPGLIDLQCNGAFGHEVGADTAALNALASRLPATGVTAFLPTVVSAAPGHTEGVVDALHAMDARGARALGLHLEGPLLSPRRAGAHDPEMIAAARFEQFDGLLQPEHVRVVTVAPEREGASEWIERLVARGVRVSLGHTDASYEQFVRGIDAGASMATHLFNAMAPFGHRAPGAVGAALDDARLVVGLIADGVHCHEVALRLALRAKGVDKVALVTDAMAGAGMPHGRYALAGREVVVDARGARLADGTLAGSTLTLDQAVRNAVALGGLRAIDALRMATEVPARVLGLHDRGTLRIGAVADLVSWDAQLFVQGVLLAGVPGFVRNHDAAG